MILHLPGLLAPKQIAAIRSALQGQAFVDGNQTVGRVSRRIKQNLELPVDAPLRLELGTAIFQALWANGAFRNAALPRTVSSFLFSRYTPGMAYGDHVDDPVMGEAGEPFRSDLSITVFLNAPGDYDGGELVIDSDHAPQEVKLPAGDGVVYPTTSIHRVDPVTRGERLVAVGWIQSMIRDPARRQIAWDLWQTLDGMAAAERGETREDVDPYRLLQKARANLLRMWVDI